MLHVDRSGLRPDNGCSLTRSGGLSLPAMSTPVITVVSGLPRSGTSMMMRMLAAGGLPVLADDVRRADDDNPNGYYELEKVKALRRDASWLPEACGRVVKVISALLEHLPPTHAYRVIFMRRRMSEILASQHDMLARRGEATATDDARMAAAFARHLAWVEAWLTHQAHMRVLFIEYGDVLANPVGQAVRINEFLGGELSMPAIMGAVDRALHRQRHAPAGEGGAAGES